MTYLLKSLFILAGVALILEPEYNHFKTTTQPSIKSLVINQGGGIMGRVFRQTQEFISSKINQPSGTEIMRQRLEERSDQGELWFKVISVESDRTFKQINLTAKSLIYACIGRFMFWGRTVLSLENFTNWAIVTFAIAFFSFIHLWRSTSKLSFREKLDQFVKK